MNSSAYQVSVLTALYLGSTTTVFKKTVIAALHIFLNNFQKPHNQDNEASTLEPSSNLDLAHHRAAAGACGHWAIASSTRQRCHNQIFKMDANGIYTGCGL